MEAAVVILEQEPEDAVRMTPKTSWIWDERSPGTGVGIFQCGLLWMPHGILLPSTVLPVIGFYAIAPDVAQACHSHYRAESSSPTGISSSSPDVVKTSNVEQQPQRPRDLQLCAALASSDDVKP